MKFGLVAGEASGDLLGAGLIRALRATLPGARFEGVAGPEMVAAGCEQWEPSESLALMGLVEPLVHVPRLLRLRSSLAKRWLASPPDAFIGIDAPDFSLGLEKRLRKNGIKTVHYVSPSIWAWRPGRVRTVEAAADRVLCILPFEKPLYDECGIDAVFVGHPKADSLPATVDCATARQALGITAGEVVAILPGSRGGEVKRLGTLLAETAARLAATRQNIRFVTPVAAPALRSAIEQQLQRVGVAEKFTLLDGNAETAMLAADVVLLASGTAALESALLGRPTVAVYRLARTTAAILRGFRLMNLSHFTLPNLMTESPLIPEFFQERAQPTAIARAVTDMLDDPERRRFIAREFAKLRNELALSANQRAADAVLELVQS